MEADTFDYIWTLLKPQGEFKRRERACRRLWANYDTDKQRDIYNAIRDKLRRGEFVNQNPYFAIEDNAISLASAAARLSSKSEPSNYNGARSFPDEPLVIAIYNGQGGIYTRREAELFNMDIRKPFKP